MAPNSGMPGSPGVVQLRRAAAARAKRVFWTGALVASLMGLISIGVDGLQLPLIENIKLKGLDFARSFGREESAAPPQYIVVIAIDDPTLEEHGASISAVTSDDFIADIVSRVRQTSAAVLVIDLDLSSGQRAGEKLGDALCGTSDSHKCRSDGLKIVIPRLLSTGARRSHECGDRPGAPGMASTAFGTGEAQFGSVYFGSVEFEVDTDEVARSFCVMRRVQAQDGRTEAQEWLPSIPLLTAALATVGDPAAGYHLAERPLFHDAIAAGMAARIGAPAPEKPCTAACERGELERLIDLPDRREFSQKTPWPGLVVIPATNVSSLQALPPGSLVFVGTTHRFARDSVSVSRIHEDLPGVIALAYATRSVLTGRTVSESPEWHHVVLEAAQVLLILLCISWFSYFLYGSRLGAVIVKSHEHESLARGVRKLAALLVVTLVFIAVGALLVIFIFLGGALVSREVRAAGYQLDFTVPVLAISVEIVARVIQLFEQMADTIYEAIGALIKRFSRRAAAGVEAGDP
ncbi:MAG: CHASE2 domain-containing protein [Steroidobacteraceae bacterium]